MQVEKMRAFIIKFLFYCIILGLSFVVLKYAFPFLMPFLVAFLIACMLQPVIHFVTEKTRLGQKPVSVLLLIAFYVLAAALITVVGSRLVIFFRDMFYALPNTYENVIAPVLASLQDRLESWFVMADPSVSAFIDVVGDNVSSALSGLVSAVSAGALGFLANTVSSIPSFLVKFVITIVASFFLVSDYYTITSFFARQLSGHSRELLFKVKQQTVAIIGKFGRAYAILMTLTFFEVLIGLSLLHVEYAFLIALITAVVDIFPVLGTGTVLIPWAVVSLIVGNFPLGIGLFVLYAIISVVRQTLEPRIVGKQIGLYPLVTLICMFVGTYLFGILGLFGLPVIVTVIVQLNQNGDIHLFK